MGSWIPRNLNGPPYFEPLEGSDQKLKSSDQKTGSFNANWRSNGQE
jgi:hypothetical protein